jgi:hypothetical protein
MLTPLISMESDGKFPWQYTALFLSHGKPATTFNSDTKKDVCALGHCSSQTDLNKNCTSFICFSLFCVSSLENQRSQLEALHLVAFVDFKLVL